MKIFADIPKTKAEHNTFIHYNVNISGSYLSVRQVAAIDLSSKHQFTLHLPLCGYVC